MTGRDTTHLVDRVRRLIDTAVDEVWRRAPLAPAAVGLTGGIFADRAWALPVWISAAATSMAAVATILMATRGRRGLSSLIVLFVGLGAGLHGMDARSLSPRNVRRVLDGGRPFEVLRIRGEVCSTPRILEDASSDFAPRASARSRTLFLMRVESAEGARGEPVPLTGCVRVFIDEPATHVRLGDRVDVFGRLRAFRPAMNPGGFDPSDYFRREGVDAGLQCELADNVRILEHRVVGVSGFPAMIRTWFGRLLRDHWPEASEDACGLMQTMVLGRRGELDRRVDERFMDLGLAHLLAVSGMNFAAVMFGAWMIARLIALRHRGTTLMLGLAAATYILAVEPAAPVMRAALATIALLVGRTAGRRARPVNVVCACLIVLLLFSPQQLFSPGFQLSFTAVLGIVVLTPAATVWVETIRDAWQSRGGKTLAVELRRRAAAAQRRARQADAWRPASYVQNVFRTTVLAGRGSLRWLGWGLVVSGAAWLATAPVIAVHFHQVQWAAPLNSLIAGPPMALLIDLGFAALILESLVPGLSLPLKHLIALIADPMMAGLDILPRGWPWIISLPSPPLWTIVVWYLALTMLALGVRLPSESEAQQRQASLLPIRVAVGRIRCFRRRGLFVAVIALLLLGTAVFGAWSRRVPHRLAITTLSVGHGLATVIELPDGRTLLYDAGGDATWDIGRGIILPFLRSRGISRLDTVFVSHANLDHFSGLAGLIDAIPIRAVVISPYVINHHRPASPVQRMLDLLCESGQRVETLDAGSTTRRDCGEVVMDVLWPPGNLPVTTSENDESLVLRLEYAGRSILLTGDIEDRAQRALLNDPRLAADVVVLPHHGSLRGSSRAFIEACRARILIQSAGPSTETFPLPKDSTMMVYHTAEHGAITVEIEDGAMRIRAFRSARSAASQSPF